jgi:hypothetical protein
MKEKIPTSFFMKESKRIFKTFEEKYKMKLYFSEISNTYEVLIYVNDFVALKIYVEYKDEGVGLLIRRISHADSLAKGFVYDISNCEIIALEEILYIRNPSLRLKSFNIEDFYTSRKNNILRQWITQTLDFLETYGSDILMGNLAIFDEICCLRSDRKSYPELYR